MSNTVKEHGLVFSLDELLDSPQGTDTWTWQPCLTLDVAQDQKAFIIIEGGRVKTYSGRKGTDEDAQSDAGRKILKVPVTAILDAVDQAWRRQFPSAWHVVEGRHGRGVSFDTEPQSFEAERDDQPSSTDEIAEEWTSDRLADELLKLGAENDWSRLRELVLLAEDTDFSLEQSSLLAPRLLEFAIQYRASNDSQDAPVVWSAIRTGASMLRPQEAKRLLPLLEPGHSIETSLVALKMLGHIFEAQPPERPDQHTDLASEVRGIAESLLNPYAIASSHQSAAMAQLAVYALAAMASSKTLNIVCSVRRLGVSWFAHQIARELRELRNSWDARSVPAAPAVFELLERAMHELQTI